MSRIAYVNGSYMMLGRAAVHVEDRGFQFSDGVYEVVAVRAGHLIDADRHLKRLWRSLGELRIAPPLGRKAMDIVVREVVARNRVEEGLVYIQINRGVARREHAFPVGVRPSIVVMARSQKLGGSAEAVEKGVKVVTLADIRWQRRDIKSVSLLPNILAKQQAKEAGAYEAWLVDDSGHVTEGSSTNAWIVTTAGLIITRSLGHDILPGVTRSAVLDLAKRKGLRLEERAFTVREVQKAAEAFMTSATSFVLPVVAIDGHKIGTGKPGAVTRDLRALYDDFSGT